MSMVTLPFDSSSTHYDFKVTLDGAIYTFEVRWNTREQAWYLDLKTEDEEPIAAGAKVVANYPLFSRCRDARRPPGAFLVFDTSGRGEDPGIADLGERVQVLYFEG